MSALFPYSFLRRRANLRNNLAVVIFLLTAHWSLLTVPAQTPEPVDTIRVDTDLVNLSVSVVSHTAAPGERQLEQKDFAVFENGTPQEILFFASGDTPFDLGLLLDLSGSSSAKSGLFRKSAKGFADPARTAD